MESQAADIAAEAATSTLLPNTGLTNADASTRLARDVNNESPTAKPRRLLSYSVPPIHSAWRLKN